MGIVSLLEGKTAPERADVKAVEALKYDLTGDHLQPKAEGDIKIHIVSQEKTEGGIIVYVKAWQGKTQLGFGDGSVEIEKFTLINPPTAIRDPLGEIKISYNLFDGTPVNRNLTENPKEAIRRVLTRLVKKLGTTKGIIVPGKVGKSVITEFPSSDLALEASGNGWATEHDVGTADLTYANNGYVMGRGDASAVIIRYYLNFDTSAIGASSTIDSVTLDMYGQDKAANGDVARTYNVFGSTASATIAAADFDACTITDDTANVYATAITEANFKTDSTTVMTFTFNATGEAAISKDGTTKVVFREVQYDGGDTAPNTSGFPYVDFLTSTATGTDEDPLLTVNYTTGGATDNALAMCNF